MVFLRFTYTILLSAVLTISSSTFGNAVEGIAKSEIKNLQKVLIASGYEIGGADGIYGKKTDAAAKDYLKYFSEDVSEITKSMLKYFVIPSPFLSSNFLGSEHGQATAIAQLINNDLRNEPIFGTRHAAELSNLLSRQLTIDEPLTRKELIVMERSISNLTVWNKVKTDTVLKKTFQIDPKVLSIEADEICGGGYQQKEFDAQEKLAQAQLDLKQAQEKLVEAQRALSKYDEIGIDVNLQQAKLAELKQERELEDFRPLVDLFS